MSRDDWASMSVEERIENGELLMRKALAKYFPNIRSDDDIVQMGRIGLWNAAKIYDPDKSEFSTLAFRCVRNSVNRYLKRMHAKRRTAIVYSLDAQVFEEDDGGKTSVENVVAPAAGWVDWSGFWESLTDDQRLIVSMRLGKYTPAEIAAYKDTTRQAVWQQLKYIRKKFDKFI